MEKKEPLQLTPDDSKSEYGQGDYQYKTENDQDNDSSSYQMCISIVFTEKKRVR